MIILEYATNYGILIIHHHKEFYHKEQRKINEFNKVKLIYINNKNIIIISYK